MNVGIAPANYGFDIMYQENISRSRDGNPHRVYVCEGDTAMNIITQEQVFSLLESSDDFAVDFDLAYQWIGYTRKDSAKKKLINNFEENFDYFVATSVEFRHSAVKSTGQEVRRKKRGKPLEKIFLTIDCFKELAMLAGTDQGRSVRKYFIQCERQLKKMGESAPPQPQQLEPTAEELDFMRSRLWEKAELEGEPISAASVMERAGFHRVRRLPSLALTNGVSVRQCWSKMTLKEQCEWVYEQEQYPPAQRDSFYFDLCHNSHLSRG
ncbi:hypothetical protein [Laspinema olomoucense]|uniref:hypothetical protein n=1 Tax=Laspinema olomoucense TaxID=3231600 RepID=UPI0021BA47E2|nr:hypothetical protein [Laspinema sp. D3d]MCT7975243.1 hypothetical protein [Laspinema sp. D3d]